MKRTTILIIALILAVVSPAQTARKKTAQSKKPRVAAAAKTRQSTAKKTATKQVKGRVKTTTRRKGKKQTYTTAEIRGLQNQRNQIARKLREQQRQLAANQADVKRRLDNLVEINGQIDERRRSIDTIQHDIHRLDGNIGIMQNQLTTLRGQLGERRANFIRSMRYMSRHSRIQDKLMFIFSAHSLQQMYRRLRFVRQYAAYQRAQGELLKAKQDEVSGKQTQLRRVRGNKNTLLVRGQQEHAKLQGQQQEQKKIVASLQGQQKQIQKVIAEQQKKSAALNAQIDRLVAIEVEKARQRAAEEARRKAAAAEAARKARAAALAKKKAEAAARARENALRVAEARRKEAEAKALARAEAQKKNAEARERAEQKAREAEAARVAAERKAEADKARQTRELAEENRKVRESASLSTADARASGGFASMKGRLPMPMSGRIVSHFGQYSVEGLSGVRLSNNGINIRSSAGSPVFNIYAGEVSAVFGFSGTMVVMVRHGAYISVYANLGSVSVHKGQHVAAHQAVGTVGSSGILQFQLRRETAKLNPEQWLR